MFYELDYVRVCGPYGAITLGAAVIGFHMSRAKRFDKNVTELLESLDTIRTKAFLAQGETLDSAFYEAIRHLQRDISQRPRIMGTPFTFRGLLAVCVVADARLLDRGAHTLTFSGKKRTAVAQEVYNLNEATFVEQVGWIFDALVQQVDAALTPNLRSVQRDDVRKIYERSIRDR